MTTKRAHQETKQGFSLWFVVCMLALFALGFFLIYLIGYSKFFSIHYESGMTLGTSTAQEQTTVAPPVPVLDTVAYDKKMLQIANNPVEPISTTSTTTVKHTYLWPTKTVYPNAGAILPFKRIVAYYGNFYSKGMGVLGKYPVPEMEQMLKAEVAKWEAADPSTPVMPAIDYIAVTAQASPGADKMYRFRMPDSQLDQAVAIAKEVNGIVILDVQVGGSTLQAELPLLKKYLSMPQVHLAIDPEFAMHGGAKPGSVIGTMDATDVNYAANYLATLVRENNLPPKVLVVHRFTEEMVTHYKLIKPLPEVQIVMDMDGWGNPAKKLGTYSRVVATEPVQFAGFKLFYKNDLLPPSTRMLTYPELLKLSPQPVFIQYQ